MKYSTAASRLTVRKLALSAVAAAAAASLAVTASASAAIITVAPDTVGTTDNLSAAITTANTNTDSSNTIILNTGSTAGVFSPLAPLPPITKNLRITADHAQQVPLGGSPIADIDGGTVPTKATNLITINPGITLQMDGMEISGAAQSGFSAIQNNGNLVLNGVQVEGNNGVGLTMTAGSSSVLNQSIVDSQSTTNGISESGGSLTLNNSDVTNNTNGGILNTGGTLALNNSLVANNNPGSRTPVPKDCNLHATTQDKSLDDDGTCGVAFSNNLYWKTGGGAAAGFAGPNANGGPTTTVQPTNISGQPDTSSPTVNAADPAKCPLTDQRYFVIPAGGPCDIGALSLNATRETLTATTPNCPVTALIIGPPKQQQVTLSSPSGIGPEQGAVTDATSTTAQPNNLADAVTGLTITNGTVSTTPFSATGPSGTGVVLTATKTTASALTSWSFTATDWAGITKLCK
jgi:hypothetical protein